jgi:hypothetical protein
MKEPQNLLEAVGKYYDANQMLVARDKTRDAVNAIAAAMKPGMIEAEAIETAKDILAESGLLRGWHDVYVRFGKNTVILDRAGSIGKAMVATRLLRVQMKTWPDAPRTSSTCFMRFGIIG